MNKDSNDMSDLCPFCEIIQSDNEKRIVVENDTAFVIHDAFPVSPGHTLVIPKRHISSFFDITEQEQTHLMNLLRQAQVQLMEELKPDAFNIGINDGLAAGQTVPHLHIHLIPRYRGDLDEVRGGVRWVIPEKADYWSDQQ